MPPPSTRRPVDGSPKLAESLPNPLHTTSYDGSVGTGAEAVVGHGEAPVRRARWTAHDRKTQLVGLATEVFAERGFAATTMDEIALRAGVTKPVLYQHFPSKQALYNELCDAITTDLTEVLTEATSRASGPRDTVGAGFNAFFSYIATHRAQFVVLYDRSDADTRGLGRVEDTLIDLVDPLIDAGLEPEHRRVLAVAVVTMAEGVARRWLGNHADLHARDLHAEAGPLAAEVAGLAWGGLRSVRPLSEER
jgi:AcrR family transcriptional regulator